MEGKSVCEKRLNAGMRPVCVLASFLPQAMVSTLYTVVGVWGQSRMRWTQSLPR